MKYKSIKINAFLNILRQCCKILIPFLTYPYICRILGADGLGKFSFADSIIQYFLIFASLGIPTYALREGARIRDDSVRIRKFISEIFTINVIAMLSSYTILLIILLIIPRINQEYTLFCILSWNIFSNVLGRDWINTIYEDFAFITIRTIIFQLVSLLLTFLFVKNTNDYLIYAIITVLTNFLSSITNLFYTQKYIPIQLIKRNNWKHHITPIFSLFCISLTMTIYVQSDITMLGFFKSDREIGIYTLTTKIYTIVKNILSAMITVSIPRLASYLGKEKKSLYNGFLNDLNDFITTFAFPAVVGLAFISRDILYIFGGKEYINGDMSLVFLCIAMLFSLYSILFANGVLIINRKEKYFLRATIISALINLSFNFIFIPLMGIEGAALTTIIAEIVVYISCIYRAKEYYEKNSNINKKNIGAGCLIIALVCTLSKVIFTNIILRIMISVIISVICYLAIMVITKNKIILSFIKNK